MSEVTRNTGKLSDYDKEGKWGWIKDDKSKEKVYLSTAVVESLKLELDLEEGCEVTFTIEKKEGANPQAVDVRLK